MSLQTASPVLHTDPWDKKLLCGQQFSLQCCSCVPVSHKWKHTMGPSARVTNTLNNQYLPALHMELIFILASHNFYIQSERNFL